MAKILTIEIDTAQLRVAEVDSRGQHIYHCFVLPVPQGAVDDGQIRDTKSLGKLLKAELTGYHTHKGIFCGRFFKDSQQGGPYSVCQERQDSKHYPGKCNGLFPD